MSGPDLRFRCVDADVSMLSQIADATARLLAAGDDPPPFPWFIAQWVPAGETTLLAGPGGGGKSYIALQLQACAALGVPWLGLSVPQCPSLGFYSEDRFEAVAGRLAAIARHYRTTVGELIACGLRVLPKPRDTALIAFDGGRRGQMTPTGEFADLQRTLETLRPELLILDNAADFLPVPSFDNGAIRLARRMAFDPLCTEFGVTIIGLQNVTLTGLRATDEAEGSSGGLAWRDAFRSRLYLRREAADADDPDAGRGRTLSRIKANNAPDEQTPIKLRWDAGAFALDLPAAGIVVNLEQRANDRWLLDAVVRIVQSGRPYSTGHTQPTYLPRLLAEEKFRPKRFGSGSIKAAYERLVRADTITIRLVNEPGQRRSYDRVVAVDGHSFSASGS